MQVSHPMAAGDRITVTCSAGEHDEVELYSQKLSVIATSSVAKKPY